MIPLSLKISGFLSYLDPVLIDFTNLDLACISGANGSGKSSILDAITWALFGQARRRDDTVINSHADSAEVVLDFLYETFTYRVQRTKPRTKTTLLEFFVKGEDDRWKPLSENSVRDTEARIQHTLRLDYETFTNASFFLQGRADQFAQQRPGDRKRILGTILGLEIWETYRENAANRRKKLEVEVAGVDAMLEEINSELKEEEERKARLKTLQQDLDRLASLRKSQESALENLRKLSASLSEQKRLVDLLEGQVRSIQTRMDQRNQNLSARQQERLELQQRLANAPVIEAQYQQWQESRKELEHWESVATNFRQHDAERSGPLLAIESERSRLAQELQTLQVGQQQVQTIEAYLPQLSSNLVILNANLSQVRLQLARRPELDASLNELQEQRGSARTENERLKLDMKELKERIEALEATSGAICPICGQPLSPTDRESLIDRLKVEGKDMGDRFRSNNDIMKQGDQRKQELEESIAALAKLEPEERSLQSQINTLEEKQRTFLQTLEQWNAFNAPRLAEVTRVINEEDYALPARAELVGINELLKELGYDAATHDRIRQAELAGRACEEQLRLLESARAALAPLEREINGLELQMQADQKELIHAKETFQKAQEKFLADAAALPDLDQSEHELFTTQEQENRLRMAVGGAQQAVEVLKSLKARHKEFNARRTEFTRQIARLKVLERAYGKDGVPALLIEQALPELEEQANSILDRLSAGAMTVRFATQKDYKDKNRDDKKETLDILISDAAGMREYELFSGGEAFRVNFAIRLALSRVLAQRAGARLQTLVIDEGFGSQDADGRQRLIEAINLVRPDFARVLVITHLEELKDAFPSRIEVEKTERGSTVRVLA